MVAALTLVTASGDVLHLHRGEDDPRFAAAAVGLGSLGIITSVTIDVIPEYTIHQRAYGGIPLSHFIPNATEIFGSADNVGAIVDFGKGEVELMYVRDRVEIGWVVHVISTELLTTDWTPPSPPQPQPPLALFLSLTVVLHCYIGRYVRDRVEEVGLRMPPPPKEDYGGVLMVDDVMAWESHHPMSTTSEGAWYD
jgi:hypothetical protein